MGVFTDCFALRRLKSTTIPPEALRCSCCGLRGSISELQNQDPGCQAETDKIGADERPATEHDPVYHPQSKTDHGDDIHAQGDRRGVALALYFEGLGRETAHRTEGRACADRRNPQTCHRFDHARVDLPPDARPGRRLFVGAPDGVFFASRCYHPLRLTHLVTHNILDRLGARPRRGSREFNAHASVRVCDF